MKMLAAALLGIALTASLAASPIDGSWKADLKTAQVSNKAMTYLVKNGGYFCSCAPSIAIPADGAFHSVSGHPYYDEMSVTIVDPHSIKTVTRKDGRISTEADRTVSVDGKTMTSVFTDRSSSNGVAVSGREILRRLGSKPAGTHAISGNWLSTKDISVSDSGLTFTVATTGNVVSFRTPTGAAYMAKLNGPQAPVTGDAGWNGVMLKGTPTNIVETDYRGAQIVAVQTMVVAANGKTMAVTSEDRMQGRTTKYVANKQ